MTRGSLAGAWVCLIVLVALAADAQQSAADSGAVALAARVQRFLVHDASILDGIAQLSFEHTELSFAFEGVLKAKFTDPEPPQQHFDLDLENRTLGEIIEALCSKDARYTWTQDGLNVNVFPRSTLNDASYLPNRRLAQFELRHVTNAQQAVFAAAAQLPPPFEQIAFAQAGGETAYGAPWSATFTNLTVRQAFNLIARRLGPRGGWVFGGSREFRTIGFHRGDIHYVSPKPRTAAQPVDGPVAGRE